MHPLDSVRVKVSRANEHIAEVEREIGLFRKTNPYSCRIEIEPNSGDKLWIVNRGIKDPPLRLSAIVGDCIHNFRSALDHLAWQLVIANGMKPKEGLTAFPICSRVNQWPRAQAKLEGMNNRAKTIIQSEQPCFSTHSYRKQWFIWLEELDSIDKHRHIQVTQAATSGGFLRPGLPINATFFIHEGMVEENTILAHVPQAYSHVDFNPAIDISFGQGSSAVGESVFLTLYEFQTLIVDTIKMFEMFFPK